RLGLLLGTSTACVAMCTYPFMRLPIAREPASTSAPCNFIAGHLPMGTDTDTADFSTKVMLYSMVFCIDTPPLATHYIILSAHDVLQIQKEMQERNEQDEQESAAHRDAYEPLDEADCGRAPCCLALHANMGGGRWYFRHECTPFRFSFSILSRRDGLSVPALWARRSSPFQTRRQLLTQSERDLRSAHVMYFA